MLTADSEDAFNEALPDISLKVYRGGARIYVPTTADADPQPYRHRYILSDRLTDRAPDCGKANRSDGVPNDVSSESTGYLQNRGSSPSLIVVTGNRLRSI